MPKTPASAKMNRKAAARNIPQSDQLEQKSPARVPKLEIGDYKVNQNDIFLVGDSEIGGGRDLVRHHLDSMNTLYRRGIPDIITNVFKGEVDMISPRKDHPDGKDIARVHAVVKFTHVEIGRPTTTHYHSGNEEVYFPSDAIRREKTYSARLRISAQITATAYFTDGRPPLVREDEIKQLTICEIPIMVGSILCNTHGLPAAALSQLGEDPTDPGGYFIVKGVEWVIDCIENILFNQVRIFKNEGHKKEVMRAEFISKPGDAYQNMAYVLIRWLNDGQITIEIVRDKLRHVPIPFYMVFRALGWSQDRQIFDNIVYDYGESTAKHMVGILKAAFKVKYPIMQDGVNAHGQAQTIRVIADHLKGEAFAYLKLDEDEVNYRQASKILYKSFDLYLLPHVGTTPPARSKKLRFLGLMIRKLLLTKLGVLEVTSRDSFKSKRIHAAGESYSKPLKSFFNATFIQQSRRKLRSDFSHMPFDQVNLASTIKSSVYGADFGRLIEQAITAGQATQLTVSAQRKITNRLSSQLLVRKNWLNVYATLRQVTTTTSDSVKQSEGASRMRRVHMSFLGYICCVHSPEGKNVGINKQLTMFASISRASSSEVIKLIIRGDPDILNVDDCPADRIAREKLRNVYVNGDWVGCSPNPFDIAKKYRKKRRALEIGVTITVHWENTQNELYIWADVGRLLRPLLIVYNNRENPEHFPPAARHAAAPFQQGLAITRDHIRLLYAKRITIDDLVRAQIVEYISPEEQDNCLVCPEFDMLRSAKNDELQEFTHCDIPEAILGITALTCPYGNHNPTVRLIYQTNQAKQTCGHPALNWPRRFDKDAFGQHEVEIPLVTTISGRFTYSNGCNVMLALMTYSAFNCEDALVVSEGATQHRGMFNGNKWTTIKTKLEQKEEFGTPDIATTADIKNANFEKLEDGIMPEGVEIEKNDAIIGKYMRISSGDDDKFQFSDRSIVYREDEPAIVQSVVVDRNQDDEKFCKVALRKNRPVAAGDKFSSRAAQKGVVALSMRDGDLPRTKEGVAPTFIVNPHAIPSRMTISQLNESLMGTLCATKGTHVDGTIFHKVDVEAIGDELEALGMHRHGVQRLYSGITGEYIDCEIFMGPVYFQRLQKFVIDQVYSVAHGPSDAITYQPLDGGKSNHGGLRIGELVVWCLTAHGVSRFISEKFRDHSDGYTWAICRGCGSPAIVNHKKNLYKCKKCKDNADIVEIPTTWSSKLLMQEIGAMNIDIKLYAEPHTYEKEATKKGAE